MRWTLRHALRCLTIVLLVLAGGTAVGGPAHARTPVAVGFDRLPEAPWRVNQPATVTGGVLTLGEYGYVGLFEDQPNEWVGTADNNLGWMVETRMRLDASVTAGCADEPARLFVGDQTSVAIVGFGKGQVCLTYPNVVSVPMDTQSAFHTYTLRVRQNRVRLYVDGKLVVDHTLTWAGGGTNTVMAESLRGVSHWTYLRFDATPSLPACTVTGTAGPDRITGGPGPDVICGGDGDDVITGGGGADVLMGGLGADTLTGDGGTDTLLGGYGDDTLTGGPGADALYGGYGTDAFPSDARADGADAISGGSGLDTADYTARPATAPVTVTLDGQDNDGLAGERDRAGVMPWDAGTVTRAGTDLEQVLGGAGDDELTGDGLENWLSGGPGLDILGGLGGTDYLDGVDGVPGDALDGGDGGDYCDADAGDTLVSCNDEQHPCDGPWCARSSAPGGVGDAPPPARTVTRGRSGVTTLAR